MAFNRRTQARRLGYGDVLKLMRCLSPFALRFVAFRSAKVRFVNALLRSKRRQLRVARPASVARPKRSVGVGNVANDASDSHALRKLRDVTHDGEHFAR